MGNITLDYNSIEIKDKNHIEKQIEKYHKIINNKTGAGNNFLGWTDDIYQIINKKEIDDIKNIAEELKDKVDVLVVIGIGGSYLGARAVIEALQTNPFKHTLTEKSQYPLIVYAGQNLDSDYHYALLDFLKDKNFAINVISKSGTTTEPALAFRLIKDLLEKQKGKKAKELIFATTDKEKGALRQLANEEGYRTFNIPENIGGRYSVLTPVGLLPIAVAGINIEELLKGAKQYQDITKNNIDNPAYIYAAIRNLLYSKGKKIEILISYIAALQYFGEWWKQLFGESEGKERKGIFPASCQFTTDLHSMGQWIQESERTIFETIINIKKPIHNIKIKENKGNLDKLNFLKDKNLSYINEKAMIGTSLAHLEGNVPYMKINVPQLTPLYLGQLIYFFEIACGISGYMLGVNPFDQPGVEAYKNNMFALIGKPGYEKEKIILEEKIEKQT